MLSFSGPARKQRHPRAKGGRAFRLAAAMLLALLGFGAWSAYAGQGIRFAPFSAERYDEARRSGQPFVLEFTADWCLPCRRLEEETLADPGVVREAEGVRFLKVDMTNPDRRTELIMHSFKIPGAPTTIVYGPDGKERTRRIGFIEAREYVKMLADAKVGAARPSAPSSGVRQI